MKKVILTKKRFIDDYIIKKESQKTIKRLGLQFPVYSNKTLAKIVAHLTCDGHLRKDKRGFLFTSGNKKSLYKWVNIIKKEFKLTGTLLRAPNESGESYIFHVCSMPYARILYLIGTPLGAKVTKQFDVPNWIKENKECSRVYLNEAFSCEGSIWNEPNRTRIRFGMYKTREFIESGQIFMESLKKMLLEHFDIQTTNTWISKNSETKKRKDGQSTFGVVFDISASSLQRFIREVGIKKTNRVT